MGAYQVAMCYVAHSHCCFVNQSINQSITSVRAPVTERTPVGKEFHARGPATEKALSLRRRLVRGRLKSPRELECKRVPEQRSQSSVRWTGAVPC